ncbi:hypothetical protein GCM10007967_16350 [Xylanimonas ulmi]
MVLNSVGERPGIAGGRGTTARWQGAASWGRRAHLPAVWRIRQPRRQGSGAVRVVRMAPPSCAVGREASQLVRLSHLLDCTLDRPPRWNNPCLRMRSTGGTAS